MYGQEHVGRLHALEFGLELGRVEGPVGTGRTVEGIDRRLAAGLDLDFGRRRVNLREDLIGHVPAAGNRQGENGEDNPEPGAKNLEVFAEMNGVARVIGHRK